MTFAKRVFTGAGIWGLLVLAPIYFLFDRIGADYPPAITHPEFFYGFLAITVPWQLAFLVIGSNPSRFRSLMPVAMVEKFFYVASLLVLYAQQRMTAGQLVVIVPDFILGVLFVASYLKTPRAL